MKHRLGRVETYPILLTTADDAVLLRVKKGNQLRQPFHKAHINGIAPRLVTVEMARHLPQGIHGYLQQTLPVYVHEVPADVKVHHIALALPVLAFLAAEVPNPADAVMRAASFDAAVVVLYERPLVELVGVVEVEVVHYAIPKHSSKYLSLLRVIYYKAFRRQWFVATRIQIVAQIFHIVF